MGERAASQAERGRGGQVWGGGERDKRGKRATTRVSLREKRSDARDDSDLASNDPQPFSHIHAPKINLWQQFFGILQLLNCSFLRLFIYMVFLIQ
jgi:hypothetical protein